MDPCDTGYISNEHFTILTRGFGQFPSDDDFARKIIPEVRMTIH